MVQAVALPRPQTPRVCPGGGFQEGPEHRRENGCVPHIATRFMVRKSVLAYKELLLSQGSRTFLLKWNEFDWL